ncbi:MAG: ParB/RepB/Spo0J family partition protein [Acidobacteria bacterium]|nr:ParB/RepB/Spo0J family partition protein [Acidobacteriota bacterium]
MSIGESVSTQPVPMEVRAVSLDRIQESKDNPRRFFDEAKLLELAENIKAHGVLQPVLVRPLPEGPEGAYELVAGARRFRASKLAGKQTIPATVRELNDAECREIQLIENLQRADIHELDEALGYRALRDLNPELYTVETIAAKIGKTAKYIYGRMKLVDLIPAVQTAFYEGRLTVAHAREIARLQPRDQERALAECFPGHRSIKSILKDRKAEAVSVRELREWIEREIHLDLKNSPFDAADGNLLPAAGPCTACPKRTGNNPLLFPEIRNKSLCTDPGCYKAKVEALVKLRVTPLIEQGRKPLQVSEVPYWQTHTKAPNTLYEGQYRRAEREGDCADTQVAVVVDGRKAGTVLHICTSEKCKTHGRASRYEVSPQEREQRRNIALAARIQKEVRLRILQAVRQELPGTLSRPDFEMVALDYFRRLGHDNHHRLFQVYGWEEKKSKTSWGGFSVEHEKLAQEQIRSMTAADLNRFIVTSALISDLYYGGYGGDDVLSKDSNLAEAASRYKVDSAKITATVKAELSAKRKGAKSAARGSKRGRQRGGAGC